MLIENVRIGFATNSSSSHSVVVLAKQPLTDHPSDDCCYGWENFTLAGTNSKRDYLAVALCDALRKQVSEEVAVAVTRDWLHPNDEALDPDSYIDHQSTPALPVSWGGAGVDKEYIDDFMNLLMRPDITILGGNDNSDGHPLLEDAKQVIAIPSDYSPSIARKNGNLWTLFSRERGWKTTFSFEDTIIPDPNAPPELIDLKITNRCYRGCDFCYQDSTPEGKHADYFYSLLDVLEKLRVFEVALGGGEPTLYPDFADLARSLWRRGVTPNFSTASMDWMRDRKRYEMLDYCGGFAYSARTMDEAREFWALAQSIGLNGTDRPAVSIQIIPALWTSILGELFPWAKAVGVPLTLLGFKQVGRGETPPNRYGGDYLKDERSAWKYIEEAISKHRTGVLSFDTTLAQRYQTEIVKLGISPRLYRLDDKTSWYIDAVEHRHGANSYSPTEPLVWREENIEYALTHRLNV